MSRHRLTSIPATLGVIAEATLVDRDPTADRLYIEV
jgi:hypothetical protein